MWTKEDSLAAQREGWDVFDAGGDGMQVQRIDAPDDGSDPLLASDAVAHRLVREGVLRGSDLHIKALAAVSETERDIINQRNP